MPLSTPPAESPLPRLLVVDDEPHILTAFARALHHGPMRGWPLALHSDPRRALDLLTARDIDVLVTDLRMPHVDGLALLDEARRLRPLCVRMILTGTPDFATAQRAVNDAGAFRYLCKPWDEAELRAHLADAAGEARRLRAQWDDAQAWRDRQDPPTAESLERRRLEALEPGITSVNLGPDGAVIIV